MLKLGNLPLLLLLLCFSSCNKNSDDACDDGQSVNELNYEMSFEIDHLADTAAIYYLDPVDADNCTDYDLIIKVAPLAGATTSEEIANALNTNTIYNARIAITEEGVKQYVCDLADLEDTDDLGNTMVYALATFKVPRDLSPSEFAATSTFDHSVFKTYFFGSYEGGDAPDIDGCVDCEDGVCPNGTPISCGCHGSFCLCTLCMYETVFE